MITPAQAQAALDQWNGELGGDWNGLGPGPDLARTVIAQAAEIARLRGTLADIAGQRTSVEIEDVDEPDFTFGYDECIGQARATLEEKT